MIDPLLRRLAAPYIHAGDLVQPRSVGERLDEPLPSDGMPGMVVQTCETLRKASASAADAGVVGLMITGAVRAAADAPLAAYQTSGEDAVVEAAAAYGGIDRRRVVRECPLAIRRAIAGFVPTDGASEVARRADA
ncbi:hypothetical protein [Nonomuraea sp. SYSU D8015]|uniref:hypothetical protein n=1 Tax=Nonomuraea sp. SYSU D8015 TaxID=2593644 RepID=UPI001660608A|nr:hypothetical protein [Nonomuraea sp. SYSU D8015]